MDLYIDLWIQPSKFSTMHRDIWIQIQQSISIFFWSERFTQYLSNRSTFDSLLRLIHISIFQSTFRCIVKNIRRHSKMKMTTSKLISGDISIDRKQLTSYNINRDTYINVQVVEYRYIQLRYDAYINIYSSSPSYIGIYLIEYIEIFQFKCNHLRPGVWIQLDSLCWG